MWVLILKLFGKIKLQHILIILVIGLSVTLSMMWNQLTYHKSESVRKGQNYKAMRDIDSLKVAHLSFKTDIELKDYIASNKDLNDLLKQQDIKIKKLQSIVYQKQVYIDNILRATDVTSIVPGIKNNVEAIEYWQDSTECLIIKGNVHYKNNVLSVNVTERKYENEMILTGSWERNQRNIFTRWFGKKHAKATVTSKCGESKTITISKDDN